MALYMGAMVAILMLAHMTGMYRNRRRNAAIFTGSAVLVFLARSQVTVHDIACMKATIPHHSIAIRVSERASIPDPRGLRLATRPSRASIARSPRWRR